MTKPTPEQINNEPPGKQLARWLCKAAGVECRFHNGNWIAVWEIELNTCHSYSPFDSLDDAWWFAERVNGRIPLGPSKAAFLFNVEDVFSSALANKRNPALALCRACVMAWAETGLAPIVEPEARRKEGEVRPD